nr:hypothetical protein [Fodinibius sp.]NIV10338.1 hypothetical protein [Fodinibius sp.]NIY23978.1 hypothetical protein [Fodinibius sp.]
AQEMRRQEIAEEQSRLLHEQALDRQYFVNAMVKPGGLLNVTPQLMEDHEAAGDPTVHRKLKPITQAHEFLDTESDNLAKGVSLLTQMTNLQRSGVAGNLPFKLQHVHGRLTEELDNRVQELKRQEAAEEAEKLRKEKEKEAKKPKPIPVAQKAAKRKQPAAKPVVQREAKWTTAETKKKVAAVKKKKAQERKTAQEKTAAAETRKKLEAKRRKKAAQAAHVSLGMMGKYAAPKKAPIKAAAIRTPDGKIYKGPSHFTIMLYNPELEQMDFKKLESGFITKKTNKFVNRKEAAVLAKSAGVKTEWDEAISEDFQELRKDAYISYKDFKAKYASPQRVIDYRPKYIKESQERGKQIDEELSRDLDKIKIGPLKEVDKVELVKLANEIGPKKKVAAKPGEKEAKRLYFELRMDQFKKTFKHVADVHITSTYKDSPVYLSKQIEADKATDAYAVYDSSTGDIWVFADNIGTVAEAKLYTFHEIGHHTFAEVFGKDADPLLKRVGLRYRNEVNQRIKDRGYDKLPQFKQMEKQYRQREAEEVLIDKFLANEDVSVVRAVKDLFNKLTRRADMESISDTEIRKVVTRMRDSLQDQRQRTIVTGEPEELIKYARAKEGRKGTATGDMVKWDIFQIIQKAAGENNVKGYLSKTGKWKGKPLTPEAIVYADTLVNNMKDSKKRKEHKEIVSIRKKIELGSLKEDSPEYLKALKKYGSKIEGQSIKHRRRFFVGKKTIYGKALKTDKKASLKRRHVLLGPVDQDVYFDKNKNFVMNTPILSSNPKLRADQIDAIVKKQKDNVEWYENWLEFMSGFKKKLGPDKIRKYIKIQGILSAGTGPQVNQRVFSEIINILESGKTLKSGPISQGGHGVSKNDLPKIMSVWNGTDTDVLLDERKLEYGPKVGTYIEAGLNPQNPEAIVIDRHMPRLWGYDITWSPNNQHDRWSLKPAVEQEIVSDIRSAADRLGIPSASVQAGLWFEARMPDVEAASYREAARVRPSKYLPKVMYQATMPESVGMGVHYTDTRLQEGAFLLGAKRDGSIMHNPYSRNDVGRRIYAHTEKNPYAELIYFYEAGTVPEPDLRGKKYVYNVDLNKLRIYDAISDPLNYNKTVRQRKAADPFAHETNILSNFLRKRGGYDGFVVKNPFGKGRWILVFNEAAVSNIPVDVDIGISDVVESVESLPQTAAELQKIAGKRGADFFSRIKKVDTRYPEVTLVGFDPAIAQFKDATSAQMEIGASLKLRGPLPAIRSMVSELAIEHGQRQAYVMHTTKEPNGIMVKFKIDPKYKSVQEVQNKLRDLGITDFNVAIKQNPGGLFIEQYLWDKAEVDKFDKARKVLQQPGYIGKMHDVHSEILGDDNVDIAPMEFRKHIDKYYEEKNAEEIYEKAIQKREQYLARLRTGEDVGRQRPTRKKGQAAEELVPRDLQEVTPPGAIPAKKFAAKYATPHMSQEQYIEGLREKFRTTGSSGINYIETVVVRETGDRIKREIDAVEYLDALNKEKSDLRSILDCMAGR